MILFWIKASISIFGAVAVSTQKSGDVYASSGCEIEKTQIKDLHCLYAQEDTLRSVWLDRDIDDFILVRDKMKKIHPEAWIYDAWGFAGFAIVDVEDGRRRESEQIEGESRGCRSRVPVESLRRWQGLQPGIFQVLCRLRSCLRDAYPQPPFTWTIGCWWAAEIFCRRWLRFLSGKRLISGKCGSITRSHIYVGYIQTRQLVDRQLVSEECRRRKKKEAVI